MNTINPGKEISVNGNSDSTPKKPTLTVRGKTYDYELIRQPIIGFAVQITRERLKDRGRTHAVTIEGARPIVLETYAMNWWDSVIEDPNDLDLGHVFRKVSGADENRVTVLPAAGAIRVSMLVRGWDYGCNLIPIGIEMAGVAVDINEDVLRESALTAITKDGKAAAS